MRLSFDSNPLFTNLTTICGGAAIGIAILLASNSPGATLLGSTAGSVAGSMAGQAYAWRRREEFEVDDGMGVPKRTSAISAPSTIRTAVASGVSTSQDLATPLPTQPLEGNLSAVEQVEVPAVARKEIAQTDIPLALQNWLSDLDVAVQHSHAASDADLVYDRLARTLGDSYADDRGGHVLRSFLGRLRWAITHNRPGTKFQLRDANQTQTRVLTSISRELARSSVFSNSFYVKSQRVLNIGLSRQAEAQEFLVGGWFERFIYQEIESLLAEAELDFEVLKNPLIRFPNKDTFELDLLLSVDGKPYLIECKTGKNSNYLNRHLEKFSSHCNKLDIDRDRAFLVVLDLDPSQEQDLDNLWPFQSASQTTFIPKLRSALGL